MPNNARAINMNGHTNNTERSTIYHRNALQALLEADKVAAHAPEICIDQAHLMAHVTPEWLEAAISKLTPSAKILALTVADEHSGMTSRMRWRIKWNDAGIAAGLPATVFIKSTPETAAHREMLAVLHMHELEARFYNELQPEIQHLAPQTWHAGAYAGGRFLIVMEDLEASQCKPYWLKDRVSIDHVRAVTTALAHMHSRYWQSERLSGDLAWVRPRTCRFGWPWLNEMTKQVRAAFPNMVDENVLPASARATLSLWQTHADKVFDHFETFPHTVLHGDSHVGNTYSKPDGSAGLFDWQVMFSGHGLRDLAYFLHSALSAEDCRNHEYAIFTHYLDCLADNGIKLEKDQAWNTYCLFILDRWDAGITSFVHGSYNHDQEAQLRGMKATVDCIEQNDIGGRLQNLINKIG
jgi:hypothetical protein